MPVSSPDMPAGISKAERVTPKIDTEASARKPLGERVMGLLKVFKRNDMAKNPDAVLEEIADLPAEPERVQPADEALPMQEKLQDNLLATEVGQENSYVERNPAQDKKEAGSDSPAALEDVQQPNQSEGEGTSTGERDLYPGSAHSAGDLTRSLAAEFKSSDRFEKKGKTNLVDTCNRTIKEYADWIAERPSRVLEAETEIRKQASILDQAAALPNLNSTEKDSIDYMRNLLGRVRSELEQRGVTQESGNEKTTNTNQNIMQNEAVTESTDKGFPVDPETAFEYAYHATSLKNVPSIAENGLLPSGMNGSYSKEIGTIWFNGYDDAPQYLEALGMLYRTHMSHVPGLVEYPSENGKMELHGVDATRTPIPAEFLEYSLDRGMTWRKDLNRFVDHPAPAS